MESEAQNLEEFKQAKPREWLQETEPQIIPWLKNVGAFIFLQIVLI